MLHRHIRSQFQGKRKIPFVATDHETSHGRVITWIVEVTSTGRRDGQPFHATHLFLTSLGTTPEALLQLLRDRWIIEGWHWIRDTQLHGVALSNLGKGAGVMGSLFTAALNQLQLTGSQWIRRGMQSVMHDMIICCQWHNLNPITQPADPLDQPCPRLCTKRSNQFNPSQNPSKGIENRHIAALIYLHIIGSE
jgi:hypothetical protein